MERLVPKKGSKSNDVRFCWMLLLGGTCRSSTEQISFCCTIPVDNGNNGNTAFISMIRSFGLSVILWTTSPTCQIILVQLFWQRCLLLSLISQKNSAIVVFSTPAQAFFTRCCVWLIQRCVRTCWSTSASRTTHATSRTQMSVSRRWWLEVSSISFSFACE